MSSIKQISVNSNTYDIHDTRITGVDSTPTASSGNVVTSGGVKTALDGKVAKTGDTMSGALKIKLDTPGLLELHRTNARGGAFVDYYPANQTTNLWRVGANNNNSFIFIPGTGGADTKMTLTNTGRLGIGVTSPSEVLDVSGSIHASGNLKFDNLDSGIRYNISYKSGGWASELLTLNAIKTGSDTSSSNVFHIGAHGNENGYQYAYIGNNNYDGSNIRFNKSGTITIGSNVIWHAGNDGSGSGLDADLLDGQHASYFATSGHTHATSITDAEESGEITLEFGSDYILRAGGTDAIFSMPSLGTTATTACAGNDSRLHSPSSLTAQTTQAVYPIKIGANGHITAYGSAVTIPTVPTFSSLTLSTTAQKYDGTHTLALPSSDPYSSARTPSSHTHGNIQNGGTLQTNDITIANGDKLVVTDSSDSSKVARTSIAFDASTATKCLTQKGTWESFTNNAGTVTSVKVGTTSYSPESGVVSLPAYPTVPTFSTLTLSKTAQAYDGTHTLALPSSDPYTSARTPSSHTHGNIQNGGTLQTTDVAIANGDKLVVTDSSDSSKVARTSLSFDGSTATKCLTQKGTWESFTNNSGTITKVGNTSSGNVSVTSNNNTASFGSAVTVGTVGGVDLKFTMPANPDTNTHRPIKVNSTQILGNNTTAVNFVSEGDINIQGNSSTGNITISHSDAYHRLYGEWDSSSIPVLEDSVDETIYEIWLFDEGNYRVLHRSYVRGEDQEMGLSFDCMDLDGSNRFCYYRLDFDDGGSPIRWRCRREGVTVFDYQDGGD